MLRGADLYHVRDRDRAAQSLQGDVAEPRKYDGVSEWRAGSGRINASG
jgi:hypothetical protein